MYVPSTVLCEPYLHFRTLALDPNDRFNVIISSYRNTIWSCFQSYRALFSIHCGNNCCTSIINTRYGTFAKRFAVYAQEIVFKLPSRRTLYDPHISAGVHSYTNRNFTNFLCEYLLIGWIVKRLKMKIKNNARDLSSLPFGIKSRFDRVLDAELLSGIRWLKCNNHSFRRIGGV